VCRDLHDLLPVADVGCGFCFVEGDGDVDAAGDDDGDAVGDPDQCVVSALQVVAGWPALVATTTASSTTPPGAGTATTTAVAATTDPASRTCGSR
jgi:hypothetical protein